MFGRGTGRILHPVSTIPEFIVSIHKERARTDRTGLSFALILLEVKSGTATAKSGHLVRMLAGRVRAVDSIGWFDPKHLGILLPSTNLEGSRKLSSDLSGLLRSHRLPAAVTFFSYPAQKLEMQMIWERTSSPV